MVHFHKRLMKNRRAKWDAHYLQYKRLKKTLKAAKTHPWFLRRTCCCLWKRLFFKACDAEENALPLLASTEQIEGDTALIQHQKERLQEFEHVIRKDFRLVQEFYLDQFELLRAEYRSMLRYVRRRESFQNVMDLDPDQEPETSEAAIAEFCCDESSGIPSASAENAPTISAKCTPNMSLTQPELHEQERENLRRSWTKLFEEVAHLRDFGTLNGTGFHKILKKCVKNFPEYGRSLSEEMMPELVTSCLCQAGDLHDFMKELETEYAAHFCQNNEELARALLHMSVSPKFSASSFRSGIRYGILLVLVIWVFWDFRVDYKYLHQVGDTHSHEYLDFTSFAPVYRCIACMLLLLWLWGVNLWVWDRRHINYPVIFTMDPNLVDEVNAESCFEWASSLTIIYLANILVVFKGYRGALPVDTDCEWLTLAMFMYMLMQGCRYMGRPIFRILCHVVIAPFGQVTFSELYAADVLTSLVKVLVDLAYSICFFSTGAFRNRHDLFCHDTLSSNYLSPILSCLPLWWRFMQCLRRYHDTHARWPNLANAAKYAIAHTVVIISALHPSLTWISVLNVSTGTTTWQVVWFISFVASTVYSFWWDAAMDFGLLFGRRGKDCGKIAQQYLLSDRRWPYYAAVGLDLLLRFGWTITILPAFSAKNTWSNLVLALLEVFRRSMWSTIRVENEHLSNCEGLRATSSSLPFYFHFSLSRQQTEPPKQKQRRVLGEATVVCVAVLLVGFGSVMSAYYR